MLISCTEVGTEWVHFYFGYESGYNTTFFVALSILIAVILIFGSVFLYGRRLTAIELADRKRFIYQLTKRYKAILVLGICNLFETSSDCIFRRRISRCGFL